MEAGGKMDKVEEEDEEEKKKESKANDGEEDKTKHQKTGYPSYLVIHASCN